MGNKASNNRSFVVIGLQERGYDVDFVLNSGLLACVQDESPAYPNGFEITERHFFINDHRLDNTGVIFVVQLLDTGIKGILMASYHHSSNC